MTRSDDELLASVATGDGAAFESLCERYREPLRRHLNAMLRDADAADDALQDVLLRVWTHARQWDGRGAARHWLYRITTNTGLNHLRSKRRRPQQPLEAPLDDGEDEGGARMPAWMIDNAAIDPQAAVERAENRALVRHLVQQLPDDKREVIRLIYDAELDTRDVARTLSIPEGTVRSRLFYAIKRLARELEARDVPQEKP